MKKPIQKRSQLSVAQWEYVLCIHEGPVPSTPTSLSLWTGAVSLCGPRVWNCVPLWSQSGRAASFGTVRKNDGNMSLEKKIVDD